eukprot:scaffold261669_cov35-Prasinocladus_malaysianus.AAC.1
MRPNPKPKRKKSISSTLLLMNHKTKKSKTVGKYDPKGEQQLTDPLILVSTLAASHLIPRGDI